MLNWQTYFEQSGYLDSPSYDETITYFSQFAQHTPWCRLKTFGMSAEGRQLHYLVVAKDNAFTPNKARRAEKAIVLIQNGIHPGEIEGKDATMLLLREMLITKEKEKLLDNLVLVIIPVLNADGHERCSEFNRPNQNGPTKMGWRVTSQNLNLNRDYMKADSPEMRGLLKLYSSWRPDIYIDNHTTNGADYQYHITFGIEKKQLLDRQLAKFAEEVFIPRINNETTSAGFLVGPYVEMKGERLEDGLIEEVNLPRFSTGYAAAQNRLCLLVETHSLKPFKNRVFSTKAMNEAVLGFAADHTKELRRMNKQADSRTVRGFALQKKALPIAFGLDMKKFSPFLFKGKQCRYEMSEVTGSEVARYSDEPNEFIIPFYDITKVTEKIVLPTAYILPREFSNIAGLMRLHGIKVQKTTADANMAVEKYRIVKHEFAKEPYEGRTRVQVTIGAFQAEEMIPAGAYIIETAQPGLKVLALLLEPLSEDSFLQWGFFNAFFERKEYAEPYVFEPIAKKMLSANDELRHAFEQKVKEDQEFASDAASRLDYIYQRSQYFDKRELIYPVFRLV